jgi:hypothetical protein
MKKKELTATEDDMLPEYDFRGGVRGKYAREFVRNPYWLGVVDRRCVRLLESDLADVFSDDAAVNEALRTILRVNAAQTPKKINAKTLTAPKPKKKKARS